MARTVTTTLLLIGLLVFGFFKFMGGNGTAHHSRDYQSNNHNGHNDSGQYRSIPINTGERTYLPKDDKSEIVHHTHYTLGYNEDLEVPNWVAYRLTEESLKAKNVPRAKRFNQDHDVSRKSAKHKDYTHSGYTRGHMAPAGDMAFSKEAMQESFFMSNMTPQLRHFNGGIWRELEENVRDWAYDNDELYIVSGPIFTSKNPERIGSSKVAVPDAFFKAILDIEGNKTKGIGFIMPHAKSDKHIREYAVSIDEIEKQTGIDLYSDLITSDEEPALEGTFNTAQWNFDKKRYNERVRNWNRQK